NYDRTDSRYYGRCVNVRLTALMLGRIPVERGGDSRGRRNPTRACSDGPLAGPSRPRCGVRRRAHPAFDGRPPAVPAAHGSPGGSAKDVRTRFSRNAGAGETFGARPRPARADRPAVGRGAGDLRSRVAPAPAL